MSQLEAIKSYAKIDLNDSLSDDWLQNADPNMDYKFLCKPRLQYATCYAMLSLIPMMVRRNFILHFSLIHSLMSYIIIFSGYDRLLPAIRAWCMK